MQVHIHKPAGKYGWIWKEMDISRNAHVKTAASCTQLDRQWIDMMLHKLTPTVDTASGKAQSLSTVYIYFIAEINNIPPKKQMKISACHYHTVGALMLIFRMMETSFIFNVVHY